MATGFVLWTWWWWLFEFLAIVEWYAFQQLASSNQSLSAMTWYIKQKGFYSNNEHKNTRSHHSIYINMVRVVLSSCTSEKKIEPDLYSARKHASAKFAWHEPENILIRHLRFLNYAMISIRVWNCRCVSKLKKKTHRFSARRSARLGLTQSIHEYVM